MFVSRLARYSDKILAADTIGIIQINFGLKLPSSFQSTDFSFIFYAHSTKTVNTKKIFQINIKCNMSILQCSMNISLKI